MPCNRRAFLHAVGLGATVATLAGCDDTPARSALDLPALARRLAGPLVTPDQPGYQLDRRSFNSLFDNRRPAAVAQCRRIEDVQVCVSGAAAAGAPIAARSGGHSYAGYSTPDGALIVDLSGLANVQVNERHALGHHLCPRGALQRHVRWP